MPMKTVDIVGVISQLGEKEEINLKNGTTKLRRHIQIADDSDKAISLTLWGDLCDRDDLSLGDVLALKAGRVSEFGGRSLNCSNDHASLYKFSELKKDQEVLKIHQWAQRKLDQNMGNVEQAFACESLTIKPQSRNDQGMRDLEKRDKQSNLNVSLQIFTLQYFS